MLIAPLALTPLTIIKIVKHSKKDGRLRFTTALGCLVFLISLAVSRILFSIFDFVLTEFDPSLYYTQPALSVYKAANLSLVVGGSFLVYTMDAHLFQLKAKGAPAYAFITAAVLVVLVPVSTMMEFSRLSVLDAMVRLAWFASVIVVSFIHGGKNQPARLASFLVAFGFLAYFIGTSLSNVFVSLAFGTVIAYLVSSIVQVSGLFLCAAGFFAYPINPQPRIKETAQKETAAGMASDALSAPSPGHRFCSSCGKPFPPEADVQFCQHCGAKMPN
ncbi:MAG: zinc ribbon domain-containing protein [Candidatus Lokiarchaeota archaeon]|nr:zinc ribbon domain-containing protein [Candidatus Lokiarchaeota archaeon]